MSVLVKCWLLMILWVSFVVMCGMLLCVWVWVSILSDGVSGRFVCSRFVSWCVKCVMLCVVVVGGWVGLWLLSDSIVMLLCVSVVCVAVVLKVMMILWCGELL